MKSATITVGAHGRLLLNEHPTECFICIDRDGSGVALFLTDEQCMEAAGELMAIARRIRKRS